jgi:hypothetical protein
MIQTYRPPSTSTDRDHNIEHRFGSARAPIESQRRSGVMCAELFMEEISNGLDVALSELKGLGSDEILSHVDGGCSASERGDPF